MKKICRKLNKKIKCCNKPHIVFVEAKTQNMNEFVCLNCGERFFITQKELEKL